MKNDHPLRLIIEGIELKVNVVETGLRIYVNSTALAPDHLFRAAIDWTK